MSANRQKEVIESFDEMDGEQGRHIGLKNVHQRIRLHYGENYGVRIQSIFGKGTKVEIFFPKEETHVQSIDCG